MLHEKSIKGGRRGPPVVGMASGVEEKKRRAQVEEGQH